MNSFCMLLFPLQCLQRLAFLAVLVAFCPSTVLIMGPFFFCFVQFIIYLFVLKILYMSSCTVKLVEKLAYINKSFKKMQN